MKRPRKVYGRIIKAINISGVESKVVPKRFRFEQTPQGILVHRLHERRQPVLITFEKLAGFAKPKFDLALDEDSATVQR